MELKYNRENVNNSLFVDQIFAAKISGVSGCKVDGSVITIYLSKKLEAQDLIDLELLINNHNSDDYTYPLIMDYVEDQYNALPIQKVDFTLHLKPEIILNKSLTKAANGRPEKAVYSLNDTDIAEVSWTFYDVPGGLYYMKEKRLAYYNSKGVLMDSFLIDRKVIDFTIPNQLAESIQERVDARGAIVDEIKAVCSGALQVALQINLEAVVTLIQPFWNNYETQRKNFIELASKDWMNDIAAIDDTVDYTWMTTPVDANGTTCKQYMLYRLGY